MGPFTLRTDYPVFALGPALHVAGRAVCVSDALPFVARPLSRICLWLWLHGGRPSVTAAVYQTWRLVRQLPQLRLSSRAALPVLCAAAPLLCLYRYAA